MMGTLFKVSINSPLRIVTNSSYIEDTGMRLVVTVVVCGTHAGRVFTLPEDTPVMGYGQLPQPYKVIKRFELDRE